jgi:outer membrane lipoprotein-sorting protein
MKSPQLLSVITLLSLSIGLTDCYKTVRIAPMATVPQKYPTASVDELTKQLRDRDQAIQRLSARVVVSFTNGGMSTGKGTTGGPFNGFILVRKPSDLRVILQMPLMGLRVFDMVSDKGKFTLMYRMPGKGDLWRQGPIGVTTISANAIENFWPPVFLDSLLVPGGNADNSMKLSESHRLIQPTTSGGPAVEEPDYDLGIMSTAKGEKLGDTRRVIHINRVNLLPRGQDIYGEEGRIVTSASYDGYKDFNGVQFPTTITISRPLNQLVLKIQITSLTLNGELADDLFKLKVPDGVTVQEMR